MIWGHAREEVVRVGNLSVSYSQRKAKRTESNQCNFILLHVAESTCAEP